MPDIRVTIDISGYLEQVQQARAKDIPFATALALTRTAQDGKIEMRRQLGRRFTLRNTWTQQGIKITPAQKLSWPIEAEVYSDTGNNSAPDYLLGQEEGQLKVAHDGHTHIAIPTQYLRSLIGRSTIIPAALRPNELLAAFTATHVGRRTKQAVKTPKSQQYVGFKQFLRGELYIFVRRPDGNSRDAIPFYLLVPEAQVRAVLGMVETVEQVATDRFETHWDDAWDGIRS